MHRHTLPTILLQEAHRKRSTFFTLCADTALAATIAECGVQGAFSAAMGRGFSRCSPLLTLHSVMAFVAEGIASHGVQLLEAPFLQNQC